MTNSYPLLLVLVLSFLQILPAPTGAAPAARKAAVKPAPGSSARAAGKTAKRQTPQIVTGPGIVICEPTVASGQAELADFASGCGRWLHLVVGGHGEFGKTPMWSTVHTVQRQFRHSNLRLSQAQARRLGASLGVTHVAVGTLEGGAAGNTLTYQLLAIDTAKPVGEPLAISGTTEQLSEALPAMARSLMARLGIKEPRVPGEVGVTAAELAVLGRIPRGDITLLHDEQVEAVRALTEKTPLAGMLVLAVDTSVGPSQRFRAVQRLLRQAPENLLVLQAVQGLAGEQLRASGDMVKRFVARFPNSYLSRTLEGGWYGMRGDRLKQRQAAWHAAQCAPRNARAWLTFGATIFDESDDIRHGRTFDQLTAQEGWQVSLTYDRWQEAVARAVKVDPGSSQAWLALARAAQFNGDNETAEQAFDKALALDKSDPAIYRWGLQQFQPKWSDNRPKLLKVAALAAESECYSELSLEVNYALWYSGLKDDRMRLLRRFFKRAQDAVLRAPKEPAYQFQLGQEYAIWQDSANAAAAFERYTEMHPLPAVAHRRVAEHYAANNNFEQAIKQLQQAAQIEASPAMAYAEIGELYENLKQWENAASTLRKSLALVPDDPEAQRLYATALYFLADYEGSIKAFQEAIRLNPSLVEAHQGLALPYEATRQWQKALDTVDRAIQLAPRRPTPYRTRAVTAWLAGRYELVPAAVRSYVRLNVWYGDAVQMAFVGSFAARRLKRSKEATALVDDAAEHLSVTKWPYPVIRYFKRELTPEQLLALATDNDKMTEARYYLGIDLLLAGRQAKAVEHFNWVKQHGTKQFTEYQLAVAELDRIPPGPGSSSKRP